MDLTPKWSLDGLETLLCEQVFVPDKALPALVDDLYEVANNPNTTELFAQLNFDDIMRHIMRRLGLGASKPARTRRSFTEDDRAHFRAALDNLLCDGEEYTVTAMKKLLPIWIESEWKLYRENLESRPKDGSTFWRYPQEAQRKQIPASKRAKQQGTF